jgi:hypothetical protein
VRLSRPAAAVLATAALVVVASASRADVVATTQALLQKRAPAIVGVRGVMVMEMSGMGRSKSQEQPMEIQGVLVDPSGIVVTGGWVHISQMMERSAPGLSVRFTPKNLKVVLGSDTSKEEDAVFVAHDTVLGVAFLQVLGLGERRLDHVDLSDAPPIALGDELFAVSRESRGFDYAPMVDRVRVNQAIQRPRSMWGVAGDGIEPGLALFDARGAPVGFIAMHASSGAFDRSNPRETDIRSFLMPAAAVHASLVRAKKVVPEALERARTDSPEPPADPPAKTEPPASDDD